MDGIEIMMGMFAKWKVEFVERKVITDERFWRLSDI
jgi:hypothetical protein